MAKRDYPVPCIKNASLPTGERVVLEFPSGATIPFASDVEAKLYVLQRKIHKEYGRCFIQTGPKQYSTFLVDEGGTPEKHEELEDTDD